MQPQSTHLTAADNPLLAPLRRQLTRPQWQNLVLLILAIQCARTLVLRQLALFLFCPDTSASCYRRLERLLANFSVSVWDALRPLWVRAVLATFAPGTGPLVLILDWTHHRDRCRSFWIMLPVGGRAVPLAFWLAPLGGGKGSQRALEDAALRELATWLPATRSVLLIGDRGFQGRHRIRSLQQRGWHFVVRVTGTTAFAAAGEAWVPLAACQPGVGEHWGREDVQLGHKRPVRVNVIAVRQPLLAPRRRADPKGKRKGPVEHDTTWYLATDLPLTVDVPAVYGWRMQIEETFRDYKAFFGLETERLQDPVARLPVLLWALLIGLTLDLQHHAPPLQQPELPHTATPPTPAPTPAPPPVRPRYPSESATRTGLHALVVSLVSGTSVFTPELRHIHCKSCRMQERPQVRERRRSEPALRNRTRASPPIHQT